jgi:transposase
MRERRPTPTRYSEDFKADALRLLDSTDEPITQVAARLGLNHWTLRGWYRDAVAKRKKKAKAVTPRAAAASETPEERIERLERDNAKLRKQVEQLEEDRVILKKAAAFFAKESE